jgi:hypothetical protein
MSRTKTIPSMTPAQAPIEQKNDAFENERKADSRKVKGVFRDLEVKGGTLKFYFKKWPGEEIMPYELTDGCEYELPVGVIKHLNNVHYIEDAYSKDLITNSGQPMKNPNPKRVSRFSFTASEFI